MRQLIDQGADPLAEIEEARAAPAVAELADRFEAEHLPRKRLGTARDYAQLLKNHIRPHFGLHVKVADVTFADIDSLHRKITKTGATYAANRCVAVVSKMFSLALRWGYRTDNPAKGIERNVEHHRRRYIGSDELARLTVALAAHPDKQSVNTVRLALLTGARRGEILGARWGRYRPCCRLVVEAAILDQTKATSSGAIKRAGAATPIGHPSRTTRRT
jgi:integrase